MAELDDLGTDDDPLEPSAEEQTGEGDGGQADATDGTTVEDTLGGEPPADRNDPQYKYWQAAYTKSRQHDRARYGTLADEHKQYGDVLRQFYQSDEYALQVMRQRFPQLAARLSMDGTSDPQRTHPNGTATSGLVQALEQELGSDLAFLAPRLGPVLEKAIQSGLQAAMHPYQQQSAQQAAMARKREEDRLLADMDSQHPGWETRHGKDMQELERVLASDDLTHPTYGSRYALMHQLLNTDVARVDATREMARAGRARMSTGRAGRQTEPNSDDEVMKAKNNASAFQIAAQAAMRELRSR